MKMIVFMLVVLAGLDASVAEAQARGYPPLGEYMMDRDAEVALARSAAPASISDLATVKMLTESGYTVVRNGRNGFVCMVLRGFAAPTYTPAPLRDLVYDAAVRAPICFTEAAARLVMPYYELRTRLALEGRGPDQIAEGVQAAYARGELPGRVTVSFAYMWSADQHLAPGIDSWRPHMMIFAPYYENDMLGDNEFGGPLPQVTDDAGTPFSVVVLPVDPQLEIGVR